MDMCGLCIYSFHPHVWSFSCSALGLGICCFLKNVAFLRKIGKHTLTYSIIIRLPYNIKKMYLQWSFEIRDMVLGAILIFCTNTTMTARFFSFTTTGGFIITIKSPVPNIQKISSVWTISKIVFVFVLTLCNAIIAILFITLLHFNIIKYFI